MGTMNTAKALKEKPFVETRVLSQGLINQILPQVRELLKVGQVRRQDDGRTNRLTLQYGYDFFKLQDGDREFVDVPEVLVDLGEAILKAFGKPLDPFSNIIISEYKPGYSLEPHADTDVSKGEGKGYYFEEDVYGVILETDPTGHLYFIYDEKAESSPDLGQTPIFEMEEAPGICFCLNGDIRTAPYFHGVSEVSKSRISITYRRVQFP